MNKRLYTKTDNILQRKFLFNALILILFQIGRGMLMQPTLFELFARIQLLIVAERTQPEGQSHIA
jgi:hypothetical protein